MKLFLKPTNQFYIVVYMVLLNFINIFIISQIQIKRCNIQASKAQEKMSEHTKYKTYAKTHLFDGCFSIHFHHSCLLFPRWSSSVSLFS